VRVRVRVRARTRARVRVRVRVRVGGQLPVKVVSGQWSVAGPQG